MKIKITFNNAGTYQKGFTLLELVVAIFILGIILTIVYSAYITTFENIEGTETQAEIYQMARTALTRMARDIESAYILNNHGSTGRFIGEDNDLDGINADTLQFTARAHIDFSNPDRYGEQTQISYFVRKNDETGVLALYRSDEINFSLLPAEEEAEEEEEQSGFVLCNNIFSINFIYRNKDGDDLDEWNSKEEPTIDKLPKMVSIELLFMNWADPEKPPLKFTTSAAILMARYQQ
ncbi:MAG: prepilin-type N-terminal cleavage/methylation domain-containing protein [Deltaproteobacteria bacterium]|nr:prepilin-type N-terminal cleavage/methylation domain-containing protein [Deltaproteobacteria bacterium]